MEIRLLSQEEYEVTLQAPMQNVSETAKEVVDLWAYADQVIEAEYHSCTAWNWRVSHIYETPDGKYQHVGIPVPKDDTYLTVIVDKPNRCVLGHYILDLGALYSSRSE